MNANKVVFVVAVEHTKLTNFPPSHIYHPQSQEKRGQLLMITETMLDGFIEKKGNWNFEGICQKCNI